MSPLNWGIGHATRIVPIAHQLHLQGAAIFICAHGAALQLLKRECPYAQFVNDMPFEIIYAKTRTGNIFKLLWQLPVMLLQVYREHSLVKKIVKQYHITTIISDNRYGFYHATVPSFFITHQLQIQVPFGKALVNKINQYYIKKFKACWVPDFEDRSISLAGKLSSNNDIENIKYIGPLSNAVKAQPLSNSDAPVLYLLSGVEPQRSILENLILLSFKQHPHKAILVRGTTLNAINIPSHKLLTVYNFCDSKQLQQLVSKCKLIIARSGYSTIMDIIKWQKNAVLIPTPGQFEQEYLAQYLSQKKWFFAVKQQDFLQFNEEECKTYTCPQLPIKLCNYDELLLN